MRTNPLTRFFLLGSCALAYYSSTFAATSILTNVPEAANYRLVYELDIPASAPGWNTTAVNYAINNAASITNGSFNRVAYYMELVKGGVTSWVYVSMNTFTADASKTGVPTLGSGEFYHHSNTPISNANIFSNVVGITTGTGINTVNLEFFPSNYGGSSGYGVPGATGSAFDFADGGASSTVAGYGSMQIHNYGAGQTLFAYNAWGSAGGNDDLGIGNSNITRVDTTNPSITYTDQDWTFAANAAGYTVRTLQIFVTPEPSRALLFTAGLLTLGLQRRRPNVRPQN